MKTAGFMAGRGSMTTGAVVQDRAPMWNYELVTGQVFPDLARRMREIEFLHSTDDEGRMNFRVKLPLRPTLICRLKNGWQRQMGN